MFKKISYLFCLFFLLIFVSCNIFFNDGEETKEIYFSLGDELTSALVNRAGDGTEYTVNFTFEGLDKKPYSVVVAKEKLGTTKFNFDKIPLNKPFTVFMEILDGENEIYSGKSNIITVTSGSDTTAIKINLESKITNISFSLKTEVALSLANRTGAGAEYNVNFTFENINREPYSVTVAKDKLEATKFNIDEIPINKSFVISMKILDGERVICIGKSDVITVEKENSKTPVTFTFSYPFTEVPVKVGTKAITVGSNPEKTYDIVEFGDWPQTKYSGDVNALKPCDKGINAWDKSVCFTDGNGGYYIKAKAKPYYEAGSHNDPTKPETNYKFSDGTIVKKDADYYFKLEPIQWRVLTDKYNGKKLLFAEKALGKCSYFPSKENVATRTVAGEAIQNNNYKYSEVRAFLNGYDYVNPNNTANSTHNGKGFIHKAFTPAAIEKIENTAVDNTAASTSDTGNKLPQSTNYFCDNTTDKIFLLSEKEVTTADYGFDFCDRYVGDGQGTKKSARQKAQTDYAKATGVYVRSNNFCWWWLRSPADTNNYSIRSIKYFGNSDYIHYCFHDYGGVVPALSILF